MPPPPHDGRAWGPNNDTTGPSRYCCCTALCCNRNFGGGWWQIRRWFHSASLSGRLFYTSRTGAGPIASARSGLARTCRVDGRYILCSIYIVRPITQQPVLIKNLCLSLPLSFLFQDDDREDGALPNLTVITPLARPRRAITHPSLPNYTHTLHLRVVVLGWRAGLYGKTVVMHARDPDRYSRPRDCSFHCRALSALPRRLIGKWDSLDVWLDTHKNDQGGGTV